MGKRGRKGPDREVLRKVEALMAKGWNVSRIAKEIGVTSVTVRRWKRQGLIGDEPVREADTSIVPLPGSGGMFDDARRLREIRKLTGVFQANVDAPSPTAHTEIPRRVDVDLDNGVKRVNELIEMLEEELKILRGQGELDGGQEAVRQVRMANVTKMLLDAHAVRHKYLVSLERVWSEHDMVPLALYADLRVHVWDVLKKELGDQAEKIFKQIAMHQAEKEQEYLNRVISQLEAEKLVKTYYESTGEEKA